VLLPLQGVLDGELRQTCTACATTLLLEFGYLSHLSGNASYGAAAAAAARTVFGMRSRPLGCVLSQHTSSTVPAILGLTLTT
jgi:Glycosyl hydrolase family 47